MSHSTSSSSSSSANTPTGMGGNGGFGQDHFNQNRIDSIRHIRIASQRYLDSLYNFFAGFLVGVLLTSVVLMLIWLMFGGRASSGDKLNNGGLPSTLSSSARDHYYFGSATSQTSSNGVALLRKKFSKPIESWSCLEIQEWLYALGPWTNRIANVAQRLKIGNFLT